MSKYHVSIVMSTPMRADTPDSTSTPNDNVCEEIFRQTFDSLDVPKLIAFLNAAPRRKRKAKGAT